MIANTLSIPQMRTIVTVCPQFPLRIGNAPRIFAVSQDEFTKNNHERCSRTRLWRCSVLRAAKSTLPCIKISTVYTYHMLLVRQPPQTMWNSFQPSSNGRTMTTILLHQSHPPDKELQALITLLRSRRARAITNAVGHLPQFDD
jgi:hypothetical protein